MGWTHTRSAIATAKRRNPSADVTDLRQKLREERLAEHIRAVVDEAPPLPQAARDRLALVLRGGAA